MFGFGKKSQSMSMNEAQQELAKDPKIVLVDVRTTDEYKQGHIPGSMNVPLDQVPATLTQKVPDKQARLFVYCLSGGRSKHAVSWMVQNGYENVTNIGGISAWNGPVTRG
jgi:phage shock protein E